MFKRSLTAALLVCTIPAVASASWFLSTQARNAGGTIDTRNKAGQTVLDGAIFKSYTTSADIPVTVTANDGYTIRSVTIGGVTMTAPASPFTATIPGSGSDKSISALFSVTGLSVTASNPGGTVSPSALGNIYYGYALRSDVTFIFTPKTGYSITNITGIPDGATSSIPGGVNQRATVTIPAGTVFNSSVAMAAVVANTTPAINAIPPQTVTTGSTVTVAASVSNVSSPTYAWSYVSGPANTATTNTTGGKLDSSSGSAYGIIPGPVLGDLAGTGTGTITFTAPSTPGQYKFKVVVGSLARMATVNVVAAAKDAVRNQCQFCHTANGIGVGKNIYSNWSSSKHGISQVMCSKCHVGSDGGSHPGAAVTAATCTNNCHAGIAATHAADSLTDCLTCHDGHTLARTAVADLQGAGKYESGQTTPGVPKAAGYVGAQKCGECHAEKYIGWSNTLHNKPLKSLAAQGDVILKNKADFVAGYNLKTTASVNPIPSSRIQTLSGAWESMTEANAPVLSTSNGDYFIKIGNVTYKIARTQGGNGKWKQRFHTKIGNAYYILPVQYNEISGKYEPYNNNNWYWSNNTPMVNGGNGAVQFTNESTEVVAQVSSLLLARNITSGNGPSAGSWDNRCAACHQTGVAIEYKSVDGSSPLEVVASSADLNIGCESCHGPGATHAVTKAAADIKQPGTWNTNVGANNYYRANEVCGQCHSRVEGFAHFSTAAGKVKLGVEAPSPEIVDGGAGKVAAGSYNVGEKILEFMEQIIPGTFKLLNGTSGNDGTIAYDDVPATASNAMKTFAAADKHHQQWHDMEIGAHGAIAQMTSNSGLTCFSCHDAHNPNSGNIKSKIVKGGVTIATSAEDNTLCLACHAGTGDFAGATASDVAIAPTGDAVKNAVYNHMTVKGAAGKGCVGSSAATWKSKYLSSVQANGNSATFGRAVYKVGQCISCHMPFTAKSGIRVSTNANGRSQGDIRNHSMKAVWPKLSGNGLTSATVVTACSACHTVSN